MIEHQDLLVEAEDALDDIEHYTNTIKEREENTKRERQMQVEAEAEEKRVQREIEEKKLQREIEAEQRSKEFELKKYEMEMEKRKLEQQFDLERLRIESTVEQEKYKIEAATLEREKKTASKQQTVRLPKLELKKFNGQILKWQAFWDSFQSTIHKNDSLSEIDKLNYLRSQLESEALKSIAGLELTETNYDVAIAMLKERYGNTELIIENHYSQLSDMSPASDKTSELRRVFDTVEQHLRSLEALGEDIEQKHHITVIKRKFPFAVIRHIEQQKEVDEIWSVKKLRDALRKYIMTNEIAELQQPQEYNEGFDLTSNGTMMLAQANQKRCFYCKQKYWSDECRTVSSLNERKEKLVEGVMSASNRNTMKAER